MKKSLVDIILIFLILFLFFCSSIIPMSAGNNIVVTTENDSLENLAFLFNYESSSTKFIGYTEQIQRKSYVNIESEELTNINKQMQPELSDGPMDSAWPMKCHDLHHTGRSPYGTADNPYDELWRFETDAWMDVSPSIDDNGIIYVGGSYEGLPEYLYAIFPNGTLKWRYRTDGLILGSAPAIAEDGTIYIGSWDNHLHAINPDGTRKWKFDADSNIYSSPAIAEDGTIYFGTMSPGYEIIAVNPNGTEKWRYGTGYIITSDPSIADDGTIYIGSSDNYLYALYSNGTLRWRFQTGDWIQGPPSIADDGTIYIGSSDNYLYALYSNGTLRWQSGIWYGSDTNPSIGSDGTIHICSSSKLFAIYHTNGTRKWEFDLGGSVGSSSSAICADGIIYTGIEIGDGDGGEIVAVNPDGTERWRRRISNSWVESSPCIGSDGTVYVCSSSFYDLEDWGHLHAFGRGELKADAHGPYIGIMNEPVQFTGSADGGYPPYSYHWEFGDEETSEEQNPSHEYTSAENYTVTLTVTDDEDNISVDTTWALIYESNEPPIKPTITGETHGKFGEPYDYTFISTDPEDQDVWYYIDWGDESNSGWIGHYDSGEEVVVSHTWDKRGTYTIKAKSKDIFDAESDWSYLEVKMPVNQYSFYSLFFRFLERFPNAFPIIRQIF